MPKAEKKRQYESDSLCTLISERLFPDPDRAVVREIGNIECDLSNLYEELREAQQAADGIKTTLMKLRRNQVLIDSAGLSRAEAINMSEQRLKLVLRKVRSIQGQIKLHESTKFTLESSRMASDMESRITRLKQRLQKVGKINASAMENDLDDIADRGEEFQEIQRRISETFVDTWQIDLHDQDEQMFQEFMADTMYEDELPAKIPVTVLAPVVEEMQRESEEATSDTALEAVPEQ